ncbi:MAG: hypothetical protein WCK49_04510 [Myxococcaceae bacterium]
MKLLIGVFCLTCGSITWAVQPNEACYLPMSELSASVSKILPFAPPALPPPVTQATQAISAVSSSISAVSAVDPTQLSQASRTFLTLGVLSCNDAGRPDQGSLSWQDSPTQLSIGDDDLQYYYGSIVGNWLFLCGTGTVLALATLNLGAETAHFPGVLILPVMFLMSPTTTSAVTLFRDGDSGQRVVGTASIALSILAAGGFTVRLLPMFFHATWDETKEEWVDSSPEFKGFVAQNGLLFRDYRPGQHWFILVELGMSMSVGVLKSYQALQQDCALVLSAASGVYNTYGLAMILLRPAKEHREQIVYGAIAGLQAVALTTQVIASKIASEDTQQSVRVVTESIITATDYMLMIKSLYDFGKRIKALFGHFYQTVDLPKIGLPSILDRGDDLSEPLIELLPIVETVPVNRAIPDSDPFSLFSSKSSTPLSLVNEITEAVPSVATEFDQYLPNPQKTPNFLLELYQTLDRDED